MSTSWVYVFSQFTPEALLFEALIIFLLGCGYTAFWILRKRRYGVVDTSLPSGPVKTYLNELIGNAEQLRLQLFGLLSSSGFNAQQLLGSSGGLSSGLLGADPDLTKKLQALEGKMSEQAKALETIATEKARMEKELAEAKSAASSGGAAGVAGASGVDVSALQQKIKELEGRLSEYSVIEDDLANLKRLQQENTQLKSTLASKGIAEPAPPASAAAPTPDSVPAPAVTSAPSPAIPAAVAAVAPTAPAPAAAPEVPAPVSDADEPAPDVFAALANQVEDSLPAAATPPAEGAAAAPAADGTPPPEGAETPAAANNTEADLVAEFEKMLKG